MNLKMTCNCNCCLFVSLSLSLVFFIFSQYCLSDAPQVLPFDPAKTSIQKYPITEMQPIYFLAETFQDAKEKLM